MDDRINKYLDQEMGPEEVTLFEAELAKDEGLRQEMEATAAAREAIESFQKHMIRKRLETYETKADTAEDHSNGKNNNGKYFFLLALALLISIGGIWYWTNQKVDTLYDSAFACACMDASRGQDQRPVQIDPAVLSICDLIKEGKYDEAIQAITENSETALSETAILLALAYERKGDPAKARSHFQEVVDKNYNCQGRAKDLGQNMDGVFYRVFR